MPSAVIYLIKCSISLSIVWIFYQLFLRRLTFYNLNRWYLLGYSVLAFFIPVINIGAMVDKDALHEKGVILFIPAIGDILSLTGKEGATAGLPAGQATWNGWNYILALVALGTLLLLVRSASRWLSLRRIRRQARQIGNTGVRIYQVDENIIPFSFGNAIYINQRLHTEKEWEEIILHEYVHIRQRHTADILLAEIFCVLNWFNPFSWLLRHSIRQNLEFIADDKVLENGVDKKNYQYHLLKVIGEPRYRLANSFNFSSLKKRIIMMNKIRSARLHLVKFLFILPLIAVLLLAFRDQYQGVFRRPGAVFINEAGIVVDMITHQPISGASIVEKTSGLTTLSDAKGFYRLQVPVSRDSVRLDLIFHKDGYVDDHGGSFFPSVKSSRGLIVFGMLRNQTDPAPPFFMNIPASILNGEPPREPGYDDALAQLQQSFRQIEDLNVFMTMEKKHPEAAMFYTTEDKEHHIVILKNGQVEKYGYPGGPTVTDMEKKYGSLPDMMTTKTHTAGKGYLFHWAKISAEAEKSFHTTSPDVLHIIFPGDSRVLAVPASGKPAYYDMDNADPKERPAFEKLYGKLPDCVPPASPSHTPNITTAPSRIVFPGADTVPKNTNASLNGPVRANVTISTKTLPSNVLYLVNGARMPAGWKIDSIPKDDIYSINVLKDQKALSTYGPGGANGVIDITTKSYVQMFARMRPVDAEDPLHSPMYIIDGKVVSPNMMKTMDPTQIQSIEILKDASSTALYGENAKNGVVLIHLKQAGTTQSTTPDDPPGAHHITVQRDTTAH